MKKEHDIYLAEGRKIINGKDRDRITQMLQGKNKVKLVAKVIVWVMQKLDNVARKEGIEVDDGVKATVAQTLFEEIIEVWRIEMTDDQKELCFSVIVQDYVKGEVAAGRIDPDKLKAQTERAVREMPPEQQQKVKESLARIQQTAKGM